MLVVGIPRGFSPSVEVDEPELALSGGGILIPGTRNTTGCVHGVTSAWGLLTDRETLFNAKVNYIVMPGSNPGNREGRARGSTETSDDKVKQLELQLSLLEFQVYVWIVRHPPLLLQPLGAFFS